jgi:GntR family transcriptional regulator, arabinose operon transcriptional repressor
MKNAASPPKYELIRQGLLAMIREQNLQPGDQIISLAEIMALYKVSKVTAVRGLVELEREGIISREQGRGTFLARREARRPQHDGTPTISVVMPTLINPFYAEVLAGIEGTLSRAGFGSEIATTDYDSAREHEILNKVLQEQRVKGIVVISWSEDDHLFDEVLGKVPLVLVDHCPLHLAGKCQFVRGDGYRGAYEGTRHLLSLGHRRVGIVRWRYADVERHEGFCAAMREAYVEDAPPILIVNSNQILAPELLAFVKEHRLTGLFFFTDMLAIQSLHILRTNGYCVPEDISLVGYDDIDAAQYLDVPLTTVSQHDYDIGHRAGQLILDQVKAGAGASGPREILFTPSLIIRSSAGPPPKVPRLVAAKR